MLDAGLFWTPAPDLRALTYRSTGLSLAAIGPRQTLISGDIAAGLAAFAATARLKGPHDTTSDAVYAVRLGPDSILLVEDGLPGGGNRSGWHEAGFAASDASDTLCAFAITGVQGLALLSRGTGVDLAAPPPPSGGAAGMMIGGVRMIVYRHGDEGLRLHVERSLAAYAWQWLVTQADLLD